MMRHNGLVGSGDVGVVGLPQDESSRNSKHHGQVKVEGEGSRAFPQNESASGHVIRDVSRIVPSCP